MEYFVSFENEPCYHWQAELLIESFKRQNLDKDLLVTISDTDLPMSQLFCRNLLSHERLICYENIGKIRQHPQLNQVYNLLWALLTKKISQPFVYFQSDMVLQNPINISFSEYAEIIFYPDPFFTVNLAAKNVGSFWEWTGKTKLDYEQRWISLGSAIVFSQIPIELFSLIVHQAELFAAKQLMDGKEIWDQTVKLAMASVLSEYSSKIFCRGDYDLVSPVMAGHGSAFFISYSDGILPEFHKSMFTYPPPNYVTMGDPIEILAETFPSPNANFLSNIAKSCLRARISVE
jgi:hypothetical protein